MLTIRFSRVGKTNKAQYKIVLQEKTAAPNGRHVEVLGSYDPHSKQAVLKEDRIKFWLEKGAQLSDTVHNLLVSKEIIKDKKKAVKISKKKSEEKVEGEGNAEGAVGEKKEDSPAGEAETPKAEEKVAEAPAEDKKPEAKEEVKPSQSSADDGTGQEKKSEEAPEKEETSKKEEAKKE